MLTRLARVLTGDERIEAVMLPDGPRVEADRIVLPELDVSPDVLTGYLDMLAARRTYSDAAAIESIRAPVEQRLAQIIDDRRACERLLARYPGARRYLMQWRAHASRDASKQWHTMPWRDRLLWLIDRTLWNETLAPEERNASLRSTLAACEAQLEAARRARSTAQSIEASRAIVASVRALASTSFNTMMFSADADDTLDAEAVSSAFDDIEDGGDASTSDPAASRADASTDAAQTGVFATDEAGRPLFSVPFTTEFDRIADMTGKGNASAWRSLLSLARAETSPLKARLERALRADEHTHWHREQERGELDRHALPKLAIAPGYRTPFRVKRVTKGRDAAVSILIDRSGSMAGKKIELARLCAAALADALMQLSFACEVLGYSSIESPEMREAYDAASASGIDMRRFNRFVERLDLTVYKRFDSNALDGLAAIECGHENPDGEALAWAADRLMARRASRRILMVLSDGYPATGDGHPLVLRQDLHERVRRMTHDGIELIGVGVLDDAVEQFYPASIVVHTLHELPAQAFNALASALLKR
jgi:cobalamin biosynthesis protein CobT